MSFKVQKTDTEWKELLTKDQFRVARKAGTERAFTGVYWDNKDAGTYRCVCCKQSLFSSQTKFDSGSGWPSFFEPVETEAVLKRDDSKLFRKRTEIVCSGCGAHLGHVFDDGPEPTGMRYCMNSAALDFSPESDQG